MDDFSDSAKIAKQLQEHSNRLKHERDTRIVRNRITKEEYEAKKAKSCDETEQLKREIKDLKEDDAFGDTETNEIIVSQESKRKRAAKRIIKEKVRKLREELRKSLELLERPRADWSDDDRAFYDTHVPSELRKELKELDKTKLELYSQKTARAKIIKERETKIADLEAKGGGGISYLQEAMPGGGTAYYEVKNQQLFFKLKSFLKN